MSTKTFSPNAQAIWECLTYYGPGTTFVQLEGALAELGLDPSGDFALIAPAMPGHHDDNLLIWVGVSQEFCDAFWEVHRADVIRFAQTEPFVYLIDGKVPTLPLVKRPPKGGYREPHWLPLSMAPKNPGEPKVADQ